MNADRDLDDDGLSCREECLTGTDPLKRDTDGDGVCDYDAYWSGIAIADSGLGAELVASFLDVFTPKWSLPVSDWSVGSVGTDSTLDGDGDGFPAWIEEAFGTSDYQVDKHPVWSSDETLPKFRLVIENNAPTLPFAKAPVLDVGGHRVVLREGQKRFERWIDEGTWCEIKLLGRQGTETDLTLACDYGRGEKAGIVLEDAKNIFNVVSCQPQASWKTAGTTRRARICQPAVKLDPDPICFHGDEERKTVACRILPEGLPFSTGRSDEIVWSLSGVKTTFAGVPAVNVRRGHVGRELVCSWQSSRDNGTNAPLTRTVRRTICSCAICECEGEERWCEVHNCDHRVCACDSSEDLEDLAMPPSAAWCPLHERYVSECLMAPETNDVRVSGFPGGHTVVSGGVDGGGSEEANVEDGTCAYIGFTDSMPVPLNDDDDNASQTVDEADLRNDDHDATWDDDLRYFLPSAFGGCPCDTHPNELTIRDGLSESPWGVRVHPADRVDPAKFGGYFAEGIEMSQEPGDFKVVTPLEDAWTGRMYTVTNAFTVLGLRLVPDLDHSDGEGVETPVDARDWALMGDLAKCGGLGYCVTPGRRHPILFRNDVMLAGDFEISFDGVTNGVLRLYAKRDAPKPFLVSATNVVCRGVAEEGKYGSPVYWVEASTNGVSGVLRYRFRGTGESAGHGCVAGLRVTAPDFRVAGDGGLRDGKIDFDDPADTNLVFWINDDYDVIQYNDESGEKDFQEDDRGDFCIAGGTVLRNCDDDVIGMFKKEKNVNFAEHRFSLTSNEVRYCMRDLEDFDRLHFRLDGRLQSNPNLTLEFRLVPRESDGGPSINLFRATGEGDFYLKGLAGIVVRTEDEKLMSEEEKDARKARTAQIEAQMRERRILPIASEWAQLNLKMIVSTNMFLYEGCSVGQGRLEVRARIRDMILAESSMEMRLAKAKSFTETYKIPNTRATETKELDELNVKITGMDEPRLASERMPRRNDRELVLLVLGWNVIDEEKEAWRDTVFKRLFWHGYRGRVGEFVWPCQCQPHPIVGNTLDPSNFDRSEHRAWLSAPLAEKCFRQLVKDGTHLTLIAHSQGNIVVGEALRRLSGYAPEALTNITYLAWQGAIPAQMYTTRHDVTIKGSGNNMDASGVAGLMSLHGKLQSLKAKLAGELAPDIFGHYPDGLTNQPPYLANALAKLRYTKNFYNRQDYALNLWIGSHETRPDNIRQDIGRFSNLFNFGYRTGTMFYVGEDQNVASHDFESKGRFCQFRSDSALTLCRPFVVYPGEKSNLRGDEPSLVKTDLKGEEKYVDGGEAAKWCVFSFVVKSRSAAIGQVEMGGVFDDSTNLQEIYQLDDLHYGHSFEFRSNIQDTWGMWKEILQGINKNKSGR